MGELLALCLTPMDCTGFIFTFGDRSGNSFGLNTLLQNHIKQLRGGQMARILEGGAAPAAFRKGPIVFQLL